MLIVPSSRQNGARAAASVSEVPSSTLDTTPSPRPSQPSRFDLPVQRVQSINVGSTATQAAIDKAIAQLQAMQPGSSLDEIRRSVAVKGVEVDELGMTHVRLDRVVNGTKVFGEQVIVHLGRDGKVARVTGDFEPISTGAIESMAALPDATAVEIAQEAFAKGGLSPEKEPVVERVVVKDQDGNFRQAIRVELENLFGSAEPQRQNFLIDAATGEVLQSWNALGGFELPEDQQRSAAGRNASPQAGGSGNDISQYNGTVDLTTTRQADGTFVLRDSTRGNGVETKDAMNRGSGSASAKDFVDNNDAWGEASDPSRAAAAVDAQYGTAMTYDFLKDVLGRNSINNQGEKLTSYIHVGSNYVNAFWDGTAMNFGDGDGDDAGSLTSLDVVGHEIVHGLTERTAGLIYSGESGGLNESFSDILGGFGVEYYAMQKNPNLHLDPFKIGDQAWTPGTPGDALRYMDDPTKDGSSVDNYSKYRSGLDVHNSSGISNNAFSLLVKGGTNRTSGIEVVGGIGADAALKIFGRALTTYMRPSTNFSQARKATIDAATDLYGADSPEVKKVKEAWTAVGVQ